MSVSENRLLSVHRIQPLFFVGLMWTVDTEWSPHFSLESFYIFNWIWLRFHIFCISYIVNIQTLLPWWLGAICAKVRCSSSHQHPTWLPHKNQEFGSCIARSGQMLQVLLGNLASSTPNWDVWVWCVTRSCCKGFHRKVPWKQYHLWFDIATHLHKHESYKKIVI